MEGESHSDEAGKPSAAIRRYNVERSCLRCHERKVRCNKAVPCSACVRAKARCHYPGPERTKRRPQKLSVADVVSRLERLERNIEAIASHGGPSTGVPAADFVMHTNGSDRALGTLSNRTTTMITRPKADAADASDASDAAHTPSEGLLLKDGPSTLYFDEALLSRVLEKERELQSALDNRWPSSKAFHTLGIGSFLVPEYSSSSNLYNLLPNHWQATQLWQLYLTNVDPFLKLFHVPTTEPCIFAAINQLEDTPAEFQALLFAIYFAAVTSIVSTDVIAILGRDRTAALSMFQRGLEVSLGTVSFMDSPTITTLQAMGIYIFCQRSHTSSRSSWILNGLLNRAAMSIGLHRDGRYFKLSPLDAEVRRRIWWHIVRTDGRVEEDHGLLAGMNMCCDADLPLNIDDADISPESSSLPPPKEGWTDMTPFLIATESCKATKQMYRVLAGLPGAGDEKTDPSQLLKDVKELFETKYLRHCDLSIPTQKAAFRIGSILLGKLEFLVRLQLMRSAHRPGESPASSIHPNEEILSLAIDTINMGYELCADDLLQNFRWQSSAYPQYQLLTYILWHLSIRPDSPHADHAWSAVQKSFHMIENDPFRPEPAPKWKVLQKLRDKAAEIRRSSCEATESSNSVSTSSLAPKVVASPDYAALGGAGYPMPDLIPIDSLSAAGDAIFETRMMWELEPISFPSWLDFPQGLQ